MPLSHAMPRAPLAAGLAALFALLTAGERESRAQDAWLTPQSPTLSSPADAHAVPLHLYLGGHLIAEKELRFFAPKTKRFTLVHGSSSRDLLPAETPGALPFAQLDLGEPGGHLVVLDGTSQVFTTPAADYVRYLRHCHFDDALADRERSGEASKPGRERSTRDLKALLQVGVTADDTFGHALGQDLEILPQANPALSPPGSALPVLVEFRGHPLPHATLGVVSRVADPLSLGAPESLFTTDDRGVATVPIDRRAFYALYTAYMVRCEGCADADWESFHTSYVFANADPTRGTTAAPEMSDGPVNADPIAPERSWKDFAVTGALLGAVGTAALGCLWVVRALRRQAKTG